MKAKEPSILIYNISKAPNIKSLLRNAVALGCKTVFVAGQKSFQFDPDKEKSGIPTSVKPMIREGHLKIIKFDKFEGCVDHIHSLGMTLIGVEIDETSKDIEAKDCFEPNCSVCFMMGNEGTGMNQKQMRFCDRFVKIRQYGGGTASLNVSIAAAIVLQAYNQWRLS
jgi:tRNA G18 (ribose-2'-O)-methylase SpoU